MALTPASTATPQQFYQGQPGTGVTTLFPAPSSTTNVPSPAATATLTSLVMTNTTTGASTITLYCVPSGGTAGVANALIATYSIAANDTVILSNLGIQLPPSSSLQGEQGTAAAITVTANGVVIQ